MMTGVRRRVPLGLLSGAALIAIVLFPSTVAGQDVRDLRKKLEKLNVRHRTAHYALAGNVSAARFREYGRALEYVHAEYARGFKSLLANDKERGARDRKAAGRKKNKKRDADSRKTSKKRRGSKKKGRSKRGGDGEAESGQAAGRGGDEAAKPEGPPEAKTLADDDPEGRFSVIIFADEDEYYNFGRDFLGASTEHTGGMHIGALELLLILDRDDAEDTYEVLFHEAFHQFLGRHVRHAPVWLNEGLATFYGTGRPSRRGLVFNNPRKDMWDLCRRMLRENRAIPLGQIVQGGPREFHDKTPLDARLFGSRPQRRDLYYAEAYTFVTMLLHDRAGKKRLQDYVREIARGDADDVELITGRFFDKRTCDRLSTAWARYVNSRPDRNLRWGAGGRR